MLAVVDFSLLPEENGYRSERTNPDASWGRYFRRCAVMELQIANLVIDLGITAELLKNEIPRHQNLLNGAASDAERSSLPVCSVLWSAVT